MLYLTNKNITIYGEVFWILLVEMTGTAPVSSEAHCMPVRL